MLIHIYLVLIG